jgi:hypothetical protein
MMAKKRICISVDDGLYMKLLDVARKTYGEGKMAISAYAHLALARSINRQHDSEIPQKIRGNKGCVYIIQEQGKGYVKIGFAKYFPDRLASLKTDNPHDLKIIAVIQDCIMQDELDLHKKYAEYRVRGEWYEAALLRVINDDITRLENSRNDGKGVPTSSDHYLYLMEA